MITTSLRKTALVAAVAGTLAAAMPAAEANLVNMSWTGAFTFLNPSGAPITNSLTDYMGTVSSANGYYANGAAGFGAPKYPANAVNGSPSTNYAGAVNTTHGWKGNRTPVSGTMSFDASNGAGVGTVNEFFFFGDTPGSGVGTNVARFLNFTFNSIDTTGTLVGSMLFSWNASGQYVSIVLDASGLFANLQAAPTTTISGVGALPATDGTNFGTTKAPLFLPIGPSPIATTTLNNASGCDGINLATQVNAYTINPTGNISNCLPLSDDGVGGDPMTGTATGSFNVNFDITSIHIDGIPSFEPVPLPPALWLFGSGLLGLFGHARQRNKFDKERLARSDW